MQHDLGAVALAPLTLISGVVTGITITALISAFCRQRHALRVIAGGGRDHAVLARRGIERHHFRVGAAQLEGKDRLQILAFQQDFAGPARAKAPAPARAANWMATS